MGIPGLSSADEILSIKTDEGDFLVVGMTGHEHLGQMFNYTAELLGAVDLLGKPKEVKLHKLLNTHATLKMKVDDVERYFDGIVTRAKRGDKRGRYETYTLTLQPCLWLTTRAKNSRVFQEESVKDIVSKVLDDYDGDVDWRLASESDYPKLDYCIQHNETDFNFISRLIEEVGIYYFFEHDDGKHTLVFIDAMAKHKNRTDSSALKWSNSMKEEHTITDWQVQEEARTGKTTLTEYDYLAPTTEIKGEDSADDPADGMDDIEWYEHPALVVQNSAKPDQQDASTPATNRAKVRMGELVSLHSSVTGATNARDMGVGVTFKLDNAPTDGDNKEYLLVAAIYNLDFALHEAIDDADKARRHEGFRCEFLAMPTGAGGGLMSMAMGGSSSTPQYRSPRTAAKPVIAGPQTAVVVCASGNEIETDKHGRIKVQFHWDREGENDENSSCWVRVAQPWAGKGYGMFALPRKGHEVVVQFLDGDPDRPLVTGSVYNNDNMPAWKLPDQATVSGVKTQSSKEGTAKLANELRFDDKKDSEYIWFHAEKDFHRMVENDAFDWVGNNESVKVVLTRKEVIGENWFMDITKDVMHNMGKDLHVNVAGDIFYTGGATFQLKLKKDFNAKVGSPADGGDLGIDVGGKTQLKSNADIVLESSTGKLSLKAGTGDLMAEGMSIKIKGATTVAIEGGIQVSLKAGSSFVDIGPAGVSIVGTMVMINSGGSAAAASSALSASPTAPTDAKKEDSITPEKKSDYNKTFDDPMPDDMGGSGAATES
ncbi:MAG: type VI secretion system Vgr family protein [Caldimonas sp.]